MDFTKNGNTYETTFSASTPFNIHIERDGGRVLSVSRRTAGEGWETIEIIRQGRVIDADVYNDITREFRIQSDVEPTMCEITFGSAVGPDAPSNEITFNVEGYEDTFKAREGMTWMEWCASEYNIYDWSCDADYDWIFLYGDDGGWFPTNYYLHDNALDYMLIGREKVKGGYTYNIFVDGIGGGGGGE